MPEAIPTSTTPCRALFRGAAALLATAALPAACQSEAFASLPSPTAGDDGELLRLCTKFQAIDAELLRLDEARGVPDEVFEPLHDEWWAHVDEVWGIPAHTLAGVRAKAAMLKALIRSTTKPAGDSAGEQFAVLLADDLLGRA